MSTSIPNLHRRETLFPAFWSFYLQFLKVVLLAAATSMLTATRVRAELPAGHVPLLGTDTLASFKLDGSQRELAHFKSIPVTGQPFTSALEVNTATAPNVEWNAQLIAPTTADVKAGDVVMIRFWL